VPVDWNELHAAHVGAILALLEVTAQQAEWSIAEIIHYRR
jgi:hypothetical protein